MKNKFKSISSVTILMACIPLFSQATSLVDSQSLDKHINNKNNTGIITIKVCSPYPLCREEIHSAQVKNKQEKAKKKSK